MADFKTIFIEEKRVRKQNAYMTVEAAFLMPMVLCLFVIVIYTSFYLYDRCLYQQDAYILCLRESIRKEKGAPCVDTAQMKNNARVQFGTKYFAISDLETNASANGKIAVFEGTATVKPTVLGNFFLMPKSIWNANFHAEKRKADPPWSIRSTRRKTFILSICLAPDNFNHELGASRTNS